MPLLNDATTVAVGDVTVNAVFHGDVQVWPPAASRPAGDANQYRWDSTRGDSDPETAYMTQAGRLIGSADPLPGSDVPYRNDWTDLLVSTAAVTFWNEDTATLIAGPCPVTNIDKGPHRWYATVDPSCVAAVLAIPDGTTISIIATP